MLKYTIQELHEMQSMPLSIKVNMTENRIRSWIDKYGVDGVYVSFSGGKDSTVLLDIVRKLYPEVLAVFVDTGLEYPEIREFVKTFNNVKWLKPKKSFRQIIMENGYPFISKEVSDKVQGARRYLKPLNKKPGVKKPVYAPFMADILGIDRRNNKKNPEYQALLKGNIPNEAQYQCLMGTYKNKDGILSKYNISKWKFLLDALFELSARCCKVMKKSPTHSFSHKSEKKPMTAQMASESRLRTQLWLKNGCNGFDMVEPVSNPMSFWTDQDVLLYIKEHNLPICSVYGNIVEVDGKSVPIQDARMTELFDLDRPFLKTTGCERTGCMFCGYGCHLEKPGEGRFLRMKKTHPKLYDYIMRPIEEGGLNYKQIIDWINEHGGFHIEY